MPKSHDPFRAIFKGAARNYDYLIAKPDSTYNPQDAANRTLEIIVHDLNVPIEQCTTRDADAGDTPPRS